MSDDSTRDLPTRALAAAVAVAGFLAGQGVGVVPPSEEIPPGPHEHDGLILSFWRLVAPDPERQPSVAEAGRSLQELHRALRNFPGELPYLASPLGEVPRLLDRIERLGGLSSADLGRPPRPGGADARPLARLEAGTWDDLCINRGPLPLQGW